VDNIRGYRSGDRTAMKIGKVYKLQYNIYDITDIGVYIVKVVSQDETLVGTHYVVDLIGTKYTFHIYPRDWSFIQELSSLEMELL